MFVRIDLSLKYSQKCNFFHFFEQKKQNFHNKQRGCRAPLFTPLHATIERIYSFNIGVFICHQIIFPILYSYMYIMNNSGVLKVHMYQEFLETCHKD